MKAGATKVLRKRTGHKLLTALLSLLLAFLNVFPSAPASASPNAVSSADPAAGLRIPSETGTIEESFTGTSGKTVYYIQDAHDSLEAQENIARLIQRFVEQDSVRTVFEEGYEGPVPLDSYFGFIRDRQLREKVSYYFMDRLRIGGAEYAYVNRKRDFRMIGADSIPGHLENVSLYAETMRRRPEIEAELQAIESETNALIYREFSRELKDWTRLKERFDAGALSLIDYLTRLDGLVRSSNRASADRYPGIALLIASRDTKDPAVLEKIKALEPRELFREIDALEEDFAAGWLDSETKKALFHYYKSLKLLRRLLDIRLTQAEFQEASEVLASMSTDTLAGFLSAQTGKTIALSKKWEQEIRSAIRFYEVAKERDRNAEMRLLRFLADPAETRAVIVFGGFHAASLKEIMKRRGISYYVITPRIGAVSPRHQNYYKQLMSAGPGNFQIVPSIRTASPVERLCEAGEIHPEAPLKEDIRVTAQVIASHPGLDPAGLDALVADALARSEVRPLQDLPMQVGADALTEPWKPVLHLETSEGIVSVNPDVREATRYLFDALQRDFQFTDAEIRGMKLFNEEDFSAERFENFLKETLRLHEKTLVKKSGSRAVPVKGYAVLLGSLLKEGNRAPRAVPFIRNITEAALAGRTAEEVLSLTSAEVPDGFRTQADSAVRAWPLHVLYEGDNPVRKTQVKERPLQPSVDEALKGKVREIFARIAEWSEQKLGEDIEPSLRAFIENIPELESRLRLVSLESPLPLLFADFDHLVARPAGVGRSRFSLYLPRRLLESFDLSIPAERDELMVHILHRIEWLFRYEQLTKAETPEADLRKAMIQFTSQFTTVNRYGLAGPERIRARLFRLMKEQIEAEAEYLVPEILESYRQIHQDIIELTKNYIGAFEGREWESRWELNAVSGKIEDFSHAVRILGYGDLADVFYQASLDFSDLVKENDPGVLPVDLEFKDLLATLRFGDLRNFLKHLKIWLTGEGLPLSPLLTEQQIRDQHIWLRDRALERLPILKTQMTQRFHRLLEIFDPSSDEAAALRKAFDEATALIAGFEQRNGLTNGDRSEIRGDPEQAARNAEILGLDLEKVKALTQKNNEVNYGATFVAGHPLSGQAGRVIRRWYGEVLDGTGGKLHLNAAFSHATAAALVRSKPSPVNASDFLAAKDFPDVDFDGLLDAMRYGPYSFTFTEVKWGDEKDGNLVLVGEVEGSNLSEIQKAFAKAGARLKWKPQPEGKKARVFVTIGNLDFETLGLLTEDEARKLGGWVASHQRIAEPMTMHVDHLRLSVYKNRHLTDMAGPDLVFPLINGGTLRQKILDISENDARLTELSQAKPAALLTDLESFLDEEGALSDEAVSEAAGLLRRGVRLGILGTPDRDLRYDTLEALVYRIGRAAYPHSEVLKNLIVFPAGAAWAYNAGDESVRYPAADWFPIYTAWLDIPGIEFAAPPEQTAFQDDFLRLAAAELTGLSDAVHVAGLVDFRPMAITVRLPEGTPADQAASMLEKLGASASAYFLERGWHVRVSSQQNSLTIENRGVDEDFARKTFAGLQEGSFVSVLSRPENDQGIVAAQDMGTEGSVPVSIRTVSGLDGAAAWLWTVRRLGFPDLSASAAKGGAELNTRLSYGKGEILETLRSNEFDAWLATLGLPETRFREILDGIPAGRDTNRMRIYAAGITDPVVREIAGREIQRRLMPNHVEYDAPAAFASLVHRDWLRDIPEEPEDWAAFRRMAHDEWPEDDRILLGVEMASRLRSLLIRDLEALNQPAEGGYEALREASEKIARRIGLLGRLMQGMEELAELKLELHEDLPPYYGILTTEDVSKIYTLSQLLRRGLERHASEFDIEGRIAHEQGRSELRLADRNEEPVLAKRVREPLPPDVMEQLRQAVPVMRRAILDASIVIRKARARIKAAGEGETGVRVKTKEGMEGPNQAVVTETDLTVQKLLFDKLEKLAALGIRFRVTAEETEGDLGRRIEEINRANADSPFEVIIDPVDGTNQFTKKESAYFGSLLSLTYHDDVIAAFFIAPEYPFEGTPGALFEASELEDGVFVSDPKKTAKTRRKYVYDETVTDFRGRVVHQYRTLDEHLGTAGFKIDRVGRSSGMATSLVAAGGTQGPVAYIDGRREGSAGRPVWDVAAGLYLIEKAGGLAVNLRGEHILPFRPGTLEGQVVPEIIAGHPNAVRQLLKPPILRNSEILGLIPERVVRQTRINEKKNYGAFLAAGRPVPDEILKTAAYMMAMLRDYGIQVDLDALHVTAGALIRSQDEPLTAGQINALDFIRLTEVLNRSASFRILFDELGFSETGDGNIVLRGRVEGPALKELQEALAAAGFPLKWDLEQDGKGKISMTVAHVNEKILRNLSGEKALELRTWLDAQKRLAQPLVLDVTDLKLIMYGGRMPLRAISRDLVLKIGDAENGRRPEEIRSWMLQAASLHAEHVRRFEKLRKIRMKGILTDVDYSVTDSGRHLSREALGEIVSKLRRGVRVGLTSSRAYSIPEEHRKRNHMGMQLGGARDLEEVEIEIRGALGADTWALEYLYLFPEDSAYGFNAAHPDVIYDFGLPPLLPAGQRAEFEHEFLPVLREYYRTELQADYGQLASILFKDYIITVQLPKAHGRMPDSRWLDQTAGKIRAFFAARKVEIDLRWSGDSFEIKTRGVDKSLAVKKFEEILGSPDFVSFDDQGQAAEGDRPEGNGVPLTNRLAGISLDKFDASNPDVVAMSVVSGLKGADAWVYAVRGLEFEGERSERRSPEETFSAATEAAAFQNKRVLVDFNDLDRNFSADELKELIFLGANGGENFQIMIYGVNITEGLGKFLESKGLGKLAPKIRPFQTPLADVAARHLKGFDGEVIHLSSGAEMSAKAAVEAILRKNGISGERQFFVLYQNAGSGGTLAVALKDLESGALRQSMEGGRLKQQLPDYMESRGGMIFVANPALAGLSRWQGAFAAAVALARSA